MIRNKQGKQFPNGKVTEEQVCEIRRLKWELPVEEIAKRYGLSVEHTRKIITLKAWRNVKCPTKTNNQPADSSKPTSSDELKDS